MAEFAPLTRKPTPAKAGGGSDRDSFGRQPARRTQVLGTSVGSAGDLVASEPGDALEREADRAAEQVMRMPGPPHASQQRAIADALERHRRAPVDPASIPERAAPSWTDAVRKRAIAYALDRARRAQPPSEHGAVREE